jgi:hypothetical protein
MERALIVSTVPGPFLQSHPAVRGPRRNSCRHHGLEDKSEETLIEVKKG